MPTRKCAVCGVPIQPTVNGASDRVASARRVAAQIDRSRNDLHVRRTGISRVLRKIVVARDDDRRVAHHVVDFRAEQPAHPA